MLNTKSAELGIAYTAPQPTHTELFKSIDSAMRDNYQNIYFARLRSNATQQQIRALYRKSKGVRWGVSSEDELMKKFNDRIAEAERITYVSTNFPANKSRANLLTGKSTIGIKPSDERMLNEPHVKDMIAAHEKGHQIRHGGFLSGGGSAANSSAVLGGFGPHEIRLEKHGHKKREAMRHSLMALPAAFFGLNAIGGVMLGVLLTSIVAKPYILKPNEVVERMAQLKTWFGMTSGDQVFTKAHFDYAKTFYVGHAYDNSMNTFFKMITPESEPRFFEAMNTLGI